MGQTVSGKFTSSRSAKSDGQKWDLQTTALGALISVEEADVITITPVVEASALDAGDVVFDVATITNAAKVSGGTVTLDSIVVIDKADQKAQLHLVFFNAAT